MRLLVLASAALLAGCGSHLTGAQALGPASSSRPTPSGAPVVLLVPCPESARPLSELRAAGLPPLVPVGGVVTCVMNAQAGGSAYDTSYDYWLKTDRDAMLHLYEYRGARPTKPGPSQEITSGERVIQGARWTWSALANGAVILATVTGGTYVELSTRGDERDIDVLVAVARDLRPLGSFPRPSAHELCSTIVHGPGPITVAAAFDSTAGAVAAWEETPHLPDGPTITRSGWRDHPSSEPVAVCYLDGDFGPPRGPSSPDVSASPRPDYDRLVYLIGIDRHPIPVVFGWRDRIDIVDPGR